MNTKLIAQIPPHPEPHTYRWTRLEELAIKEYGDKRAADALEAVQPAGEPVAWQSTSLGESILTPEQKNGNYFGYSDEFLASHTIQLYTHLPAPQVPMTEECFFRLWVTTGGWLGADDDDIRAFARAIEAHHKIGVKP